MAEAGRNRVNETSPQRWQSRLCAWTGGLAQLQRDALVLWDSERWVEKQRVAMEHPLGVGRLSDGGLIATERPAALAGNIRLHILSPDGTSWRKAQGYVSYPSFIAAGRAANEFISAGPSHRYGLERYTIYGSDDIRIEESIPLDGDDALVSIGPSAAARLHGREILKLSFPAAKTNYALPASVQNPVHLSYSGKGDSFWVSADKAVHLVTLGSAVRVDKTVPVGSGRIYHIDAADDQIAVLLLNEAAGTIQGWTLVLYKDGAELWRAPVPKGPPEDRFVALVAGAVVVSEGGGLLVWDRKTGTRRK